MAIHTQRRGNRPSAQPRDLAEVDGKRREAWITLTSAALPPARSLTSALSSIDVGPRDSGNSRRGGDMTKIVALTLVIGVLVAGSAIFAKNHPRALTACVTNCE